MEAQWIVRDSDNPSIAFQGTVLECDRWCRENHIKFTLWTELTKNINEG